MVNPKPGKQRRLPCQKKKKRKRGDYGRLTVSVKFSHSRTINRTMMSSFWHDRKSTRLDEVAYLVFDDKAPPFHMDRLARLSPTIIRIYHGLQWLNEMLSLWPFFLLCFPPPAFVVNISLIPCFHKAHSIKSYINNIFTINNRW